MIMLLEEKDLIAKEPVGLRLNGLTNKLVIVRLYIWLGKRSELNPETEMVYELMTIEQVNRKPCRKQL